MKILLICCPTQKKFLPLESIGLGYLASILRNEGHEVEILDTDLQYSFVPVDKQLSIINNHINKNMYDIIGISVNDESYIPATKIIKMVKEIKMIRKVKLILGGYLPTFADQILIEKFKTIDFILRGEGEYSFVHLLNELMNNCNFDKVKGLTYRKNGKITINPKNELVSDLNSLPFPARDNIGFLNITNTPVAISSSRGCKGNCIYCSISSFYRKCEGQQWRVRSVKNIVDEIEMIINKYKKDNFVFVDDEFIGGNFDADSNHLMEFVNEVKERNINIKFKIFCRCDHISREKIHALKSIGLYSVFLGIESFSNKRLKFMTKGIFAKTNFEAVKILEEAKINYVIGFIPMDINTTLGEVKEEYENLLIINSNEHFIGNPGITSRDIKMIPYYGSPYYKFLKNRNSLLGKFPSYTYKFDDEDVNKLYEILSSLDLNWVDYKLRIDPKTIDSKYNDLSVKIMKKINARRRDAEISLVLELVNLIKAGDDQKKIDTALNDFNLKIVGILNDVNDIIIKINQKKM